MILLINSFIFSLACFYVSSKIFKFKIDYKKKDYWIVVFINTLLITLSFVITTHFLRVVFNYIILLILNKYYFNKPFFELMLGSFFTFVVITVSEIFMAIMLVSVFKIEITQLSESYIGQFYINIIISIIMVLIVNVRESGRFFKIFSDNVKTKGLEGIAPLVLIIIVIYAALLYYIYYQINGITVMILSVILITIICVLLMTVLKEKNYSVNLKKEYEELISNLNEYEKVLEKYRLTNHENINNFIIIKGMLEKNESDVVKQIDEIICNKQQDDNEILFKTKKLPTGGLQGLVYQKMLIMKEKNIICNLEISKHINAKKMKTLESELNKKICTIVGIFIDNAIEAVVDLNKKNVGLYLYMENNELCFSISNNFSGIINLDKIDNIGYSSKGKGRGYGLGLVKKIVDKDERIIIKREIIRDSFKQIIKIKM